MNIKSIFARKWNPFRWIMTFGSTFSQILKKMFRNIYPIENSPWIFELYFQLNICVDFRDGILTRILPKSYPENMTFLIFLGKKYQQNQKVSLI